MTTDPDYVACYRIGYAAAGTVGVRADDDSESFDDRAFPVAFSDALDGFPDVDARDISEAVHDGIRARWDELSREPR